MRTFLQKGHTDGKQTHEKLTTQLATVNTAKATVGVHTHILEQLTQNRNNTKCWEGHREFGSLRNCPWTCEMAQPLCKIA
jgi:hypothetical protein